MTIIVRRASGEAFELVTGRHRLTAALQVFGNPNTTDRELTAQTRAAVARAARTTP